jgi:ankyrin repeat protein
MAKKRLRLGHGEVVKLLLEKGALVTARDSGGKTYLDLAKGKDIEKSRRSLEHTERENKVSGSTLKASAGRPRPSQDRRMMPDQDT